MKRTIAELKANIPNGGQYIGKVDNNTIMFLKDGFRGWILHDTVIAEEVSYGLLRLNSDYYRTLTTKDRLNKVLEQVFPGKGLAIWQHDNKWDLYQWGHKVADYKDNMILGLDVAGAVYVKYAKVQA